MSRYEDVDPDELRSHLVRVAELILQLEQEGDLLREAPRLQKVLGDLRQRLFAYEVRCAADLGDDDPADGGAERPPEDEDPGLRESLRIVREAMERQEELRDELASGTTPPEDEDEEKED